MFFSCSSLCCGYKIAAEQKARATYEYLIDMADDPDVIAPLRFLREREVVHFQRFGEVMNYLNDLKEQGKLYIGNINS